MPTPPHPSINEYVTRHYVDARFADHHKEHQAEQRALDAAAKAVDTRLEGMNEFRASLNDASRTFVTRDVMDVQLDARDDKIDALAASAQRSAMLAGITAGVIGVIGGFLLSQVVP